MSIAGRFGELDGHMHGYDPALILRGIAQTIAAGRLTYLAIPDEAADAIPRELERSPVDDALTELAGDRCMVPWRDNARQFAYYCLLPAGHDDEAGHDAGELVPEHGWYRLLDAYARGREAMDQAADRIAERAEAARRRLPSPPPHR